jgi:uncharacterized membrane protein YccF (DUF307 family)
LSLILNVIWVVLGGWYMALAWCVAGALMAITIVLLPWSRAAFAIASFTLWPFGREAIDREILTGRADIGTGDLGFIGNVIWFCCAGLWLAIGHVVTAAALAVTIIGLPLAWAHLKLAAISIAPIGKTIVDSAVAEEARRRHAAEAVSRLRQ